MFRQPHNIQKGKRQSRLDVQKKQAQLVSSLLRIGILSHFH